MEVRYSHSQNIIMKHRRTEQVWCDSLFFPSLFSLHHQNNTYLGLTRLTIATSQAREFSFSHLSLPTEAAQRSEALFSKHLQHSSLPSNPQRWRSAIDYGGTRPCHAVSSGSHQHENRCPKAWPSGWWPNTVGNAYSWYRTWSPLRVISCDGVKPVWLPYMWLCSRRRFWVR